MQIKGTVEKLYPQVDRTGKNDKVYSFQLVIIDQQVQDNRYPSKVAVEMQGGAMNVLVVGQFIDINVKAQSREWNDKWFTNLSYWKPVGEGTPAPQTNTGVPIPAAQGNIPVNDAFDSSDPKDGLPF